MNASDLLTPWMILAAVLIPLVYVEEWIHSHLYGVGWLLTNDNRSATTLYYVLLFPGIFLHEVVQWLVAGAINVDTKSVRVWPEPQKDGTLRLDFVQLKHPNRVASALIGAAPLIAGLALVWVISNYILNLDVLLEALGTGDLRAISSAIRALGSAPDFYLWLYLLFAISNAMLPTPSDRQGWSLLFVLFASVVIFLIIIGTGDRLLETYQDAVVIGLERLTTAFATVLVIEFPAILVIGFSEEILERTTQRKFQYKPPVEFKPRQPGSNEPLPLGEPKPSIYLLELPIPLPPDKPKPRYTEQSERSISQRTPPARDTGGRPEIRSRPSTAGSPSQPPVASPAQPSSAEQHPAGVTGPASISPRRPDEPRVAGAQAERRTSPTQDTSPGAQTSQMTPSSPIRPQSPRDDSDPTMRRPESQARPATEARSTRDNAGQSVSPRDRTIEPDAPERREAPPGDIRQVSERARFAPPQPHTPGEPERSTGRPDRPAGPAGGPGNDRPRGAFSPSEDDRFRRPAPEPSSPPRPGTPRSTASGLRNEAEPGHPDRDQKTEETGTQRDTLARPAGSRFAGTGQRDQPARPGSSDPRSRSSRPAPSFVEDDEETEDEDTGDELEYVPFDDIDLPNDDDQDDDENDL